MHQMCACLTNIYMYCIHIQVCIYKKHILRAHLYTRSTAATKKLEDRAVGRLVDICSLLLGWCWPQLQWVDIDQCVTVLHHLELTCIWSTEKHLGNVILWAWPVHIQHRKKCATPERQRGDEGHRVGDRCPSQGTWWHWDDNRESQRYSQPSKKDFYQRLYVKKRRKRKNQLLKLKLYKFRLEIRHMLLTGRLINHGRTPRCGRFLNTG